MDAGHDTARDGCPDDVEGIDAGRFATWIEGVHAAMRGDADSDVPCGACAGCCTSAQFVLVEADEHDTRGHIPTALLVPAPGRRGDHVLGYDEHGRCPMLHDDRCSIYDHRPRACRVYDCRVFAAAGVDPDAVRQPAIAERVRRWRFAHHDARDHMEHDAARAAGAFVAAHADALFDGATPPPVGLAVAAVTAQPLFVAHGEGSAPRRVTPTVADVQVHLRSRVRR